MTHHNLGYGADKQYGPFRRNHVLHLHTTLGFRFHQLAPLFDHRLDGFPDHWIVDVLHLLQQFGQPGVDQGDFRLEIEQIGIRLRGQIASSQPRWYVLRVPAVGGLGRGKTAR